MGVDDGYHLFRGILFLHHALPGHLELNDPPLGEAIGAMPLLFAPEVPDYRQIQDDSFAFHLHERTLIAIGLLKSLLLLPLVAMVFVWATRRWGINAGWLGVTLVLTEPTIAAHAPLPTTDVLGMEAIALTAILVWSFFVRPGFGKAVGAGAAIGVSLMIKHTAVILPGIAVLMAVMWWGVLPMWQQGGMRRWLAELPRRMAWLVTGAGSMLLALWVATGFDFSRPYYPSFWNAPSLVQLLCAHRMPAGIYLSSFFGAYGHTLIGHRAFLFGKISEFGWWYYFPAIATMKIPLGIWGLFVLAIISLWYCRPRWSEAGAALCLICYSALLMHSTIDIGFRHALPAYIFALLLCVRVAAMNRIFLVLAWVCAAATLGHVASYHPDYLAYVNRPMGKPWLKMADSNLDWGRVSKQVGKWVRAHATSPSRPVTYFEVGSWQVHSEWLPGVTAGSLDHLPASGLVIVGPNYLDGIKDPGLHLRKLQRLEPTAVIAHSQLVFDLDWFSKGKGFRWDK